MPLPLADLVSTLEDIATDGPGSAPEAAKQWADAVLAYASAVTPTAVAPAAVAAAAVLQGVLAGAFATPAAAVAMDAAFVVFGTAMGGAMAPAFVATPPAAPPGFVSLFATKRDTAAQAAEDVGNAIDAWMKTGTAVPALGGAAVNWA